MSDGKCFCQLESIYVHQSVLFQFSSNSVYFKSRNINIQRYQIPFLRVQAPNEQTLKRYADTQVNLTTFRLVQSHLPDNEFTTSHYSKREYAAVYDSLLALYHGIKLHYRNNRSCIWIGKDGIEAVLTKV